MSEIKDAATSSGTALSPEDEEFADDMTAWVKSTLGADLSTKFADDDWTAIVKMHAMIETALNTILVRHFGFPELEKIIGRLDTSNMATGKVAFAKALGIINKELAVFIQKLSELRNHCVHDIRNFDFNLVKYFENLSEHDQKALIRATDKVREPGAPIIAGIGNKLFIATITVLIHVRIHHMRCESRDMGREILRLKAGKHDALNPPTPKEE